MNGIFATVGSMVGSPGLLLPMTVAFHMVGVLRNLKASSHLPRRLLSQISSIFCLHPV